MHAPTWNDVLCKFLESNVSFGTGEDSLVKVMETPSLEIVRVNVSLKLRGELCIRIHSECINRLERTGFCDGGKRIRDSLFNFE